MKEKWHKYLVFILSIFIVGIILGTLFYYMAPSNILDSIKDLKISSNYYLTDIIILSVSLISSFYIIGGLIIIMYLLYEFFIIGFLINVGIHSNIFNIISSILIERFIPVLLMIILSRKIIQISKNSLENILYKKKNDSMNIIKKGIYLLGMIILYDIIVKVILLVI